MNILFISQHKSPHTGGVEKHVKNISKIIHEQGYSINVISSEDIKYPKIKVLGLLYIWSWLFKNIKLILKSDIIHIHDVFIWYLPFRFLFPLKKVYVTFHGWEGKYPVPLWNILNRKVANKLSSGSIAVGEYIEKYYGIKSDFVIYGGVNKVNKDKISTKKLNSVIFLGRLEKDTGILEFLKFLKQNKQKYNVTFVGDGSLRKLCQIYGHVIGNIDNVDRYLKKSKYCVPSGYLSYLEAVNNDCKIMTFASNPLKEDYWLGVKKIRRIPTWDEVSNTYIKLWKK